MAKPFKSEYDLMAEAYGNISYSKQRLINEDKAGRRVRGYTQQQGQLITEAEGTTLEIGGQTYTVGEQDPNDDGTIIEIEKHRNGYFITGGEYTDMQGEGSYADDRDNPKVGYGYALTLDGKPMDEDDLEDRDMDHDLSTVDRGTGRFEDAEGSNIDQVEALTASISDGIIQLARLMDSEEMVDDDDLSIGAAATNALENLKAMLNNIV